MLEMSKLSLSAAFLFPKQTHARALVNVYRVQLSARHLDISHRSSSPVLRCQHNRLEALKTAIPEEEEKEE